MSRQHVQVTVNGLLQKGLLRREQNPSHKRSQLVRLSELGRATFKEIRRNEASEIARIYAGVSDDAIATTRDTLEALFLKLD